MRWRHRLKLEKKVLGLGIERIDYTKGIPERIRAIDRLLDEHPEHRGRIVFAQVGVPSRVHIEAYKKLDDEIDALVEEVNWKWGIGAWRPIVYEKRHFNQVEMMALHRLAQFCVVSSLHDGMNLVAKEFVSSRVDEDGVLILSQFSGAARELTDAVLVNPVLRRGALRRDAPGARRCPARSAAAGCAGCARWSPRTTSTAGRRRSSRR